MLIVDIQKNKTAAVKLNILVINNNNSNERIKRKVFYFVK